MKRKSKVSGQTIVEYVVLFTVVCGVVVLVATTVFRANLAELYGRMADIIGNLRPSI